MSLCGCIMYVFGCPQTSGEGVHVRRDTDKLCLVDEPVWRGADFALVDQFVQGAAGDA